MDHQKNILQFDDLALDPTSLIGARELPVGARCIGKFGKLHQWGFTHFTTHLGKQENLARYGEGWENESDNIPPITRCNYCLEDVLQVGSLCGVCWRQYKDDRPETIMYINCLACMRENYHLVPTGELEMPKGPRVCLGCNIPVCGVCQICETANCRFVGYLITSPDQLASKRHLMAQTQKVRGFVSLTSVKGLSVPRPYFVVVEPSDADTVPLQDFVQRGQGVFVRPCPIRPRHGFVESRRLMAGTIEGMREEVRSILIEAKAADPQAELLILPYVPASHNIVATPQKISIGAGHDGATAGRDTLSLPLMGTMFMELTPAILDKAQVDREKDDPYVELVVQGSYPIMTQLRAGAKAPKLDDFIPHRMQVQEIVEPSDDMLEWERTVKTLSRGTVVCRVGGSLISHYGVHCLYNNIPVLTTRRPQIGEWLEPINEKSVEPDLGAFRTGLAAGVLAPIHDTGEASDHIKVLLVALHNAGALSGQSAFWLGYSVSIMMRVGMAASHGEARHADSSRKYLGRDQIYGMSFKDFFGTRRMLGAAQYDFLYYKHWPSSYGGKKWGMCTQAVIELDLAVRLFLIEPTKETLATVVSKLNNAVNQAHNGGWWLDKFIEKARFDQAAKQSLYMIARAAVQMYDLREAFAGIPAERFQAVLDVWAKEPEIPIVKGNGSTTSSMYKAHPDEPSVDEDDPPPLDDDDDDGDGPCQCDMCTGKNKAIDPMNVNVNGQVPITPDTMITVAQCKSVWAGPNLTSMHVQIRTDGTTGYYSFDLASIPGAPDKYASGSESFSGSGAMYRIMQFEQVEGVIWRFTTGSVDFTYDIQAQKIVQEQYKPGGQTDGATVEAATV